MLARVTGELLIASRLRRREPWSSHTQAHSFFLLSSLIILVGTDDPGPTGFWVSSTHLHSHFLKPTVHAHCFMHAHAMEPFADVPRYGNVPGLQPVCVLVEVPRGGWPQSGPPSLQ